MGTPASRRQASKACPNRSFDVGPSSLTAWALLIARALEARGFDARALFQQAGVQLDQLRDPDARVPVATVQRLWRLGASATGDPCFGIEAGRLWHPTTCHALGYTALSSATLREALGYLVRYSRVVSTGAHIDLKESAAEAHLCVHPRVDGIPVTSEGMRLAIQAGFSANFQLCKLLAGGSPVMRVLVTQPAAGCEARFEAYFRCPVEFSSRHNCMVFSAATLDRKLLTMNPALLRINEHALVEYLGRLDSSEFCSRVRSQMLHRLPEGSADAARIARALNVSVRTLQRRLAEDGHSFRGLLDDTRRELARRYERDTTLASAEIAYLLGFSEPSSFARARRRWHAAQMRRPVPPPRRGLDHRPMAERRG